MAKTDLEQKLSKGEKTKELSIQSAIHCLANLGYAETTFQAIADHSGLSQPLVVHYFKKKENVFPTVIDYLIQRAQATQLPPHSSSATEDLRVYLAAAVQIFRFAPSTSRVYFTLTYLAVFKDQYKTSYAKIREANIHRLTDIIAKGIAHKEFSSGSILLKAQIINSFLAGVFVDLMIANSTASDEEILELLFKGSLALLL